MKAYQQSGTRDIIREYHGFGTGPRKGAAQGNRYTLGARGYLVELAEADEDPELAARKGNVMAKDFNYQHWCYQ